MVGVALRGTLRRDDPRRGEQHTAVSDATSWQRERLPFCNAATTGRNNDELPAALVRYVIGFA